jgi:DNA repair protein SbcC/Rad50
LDEGFGRLDSETLDAALNALESLRLSGRTIGVISHINQLSRRIPVRIDVKRTGVGTSMSIKMQFFRAKKNINM